MFYLVLATQPLHHIPHCGSSQYSQFLPKKTSHHCWSPICLLGHSDLNSILLSALAPKKGVTLFQ